MAEARPRQTLFACRECRARNPRAHRRRRQDCYRPWQRTRRFAEEFTDSVSLPYSEDPGFVSSTAQGHVGSLVAGKVEGIPVLAMQGRVHYYEGYSLEEVTLPVGRFKLLGVKHLILTNAAAVLMCN